MSKFSFIDTNLATLCGTRVLPSVDTYENEATLVFKSDQVSNDKTGFVVRVNASVEECGGVFEAS